MGGSSSTSGGCAKPHLALGRNTNSGMVRGEPWPSAGTATTVRGWSSVDRPRELLLAAYGENLMAAVNAAGRSREEDWRLRHRWPQRPFAIRAIATSFPAPVQGDGRRGANCSATMAGPRLPIAGDLEEARACDPRAWQLRPGREWLSCAETTGTRGRRRDTPDRRPPGPRRARLNHRSHRSSPPMRRRRARQVERRALPRHRPC